MAMTSQALQLPSGLEATAARSSPKCLSELSRNGGGFSALRLDLANMTSPLFSLNMNQPNEGMLAMLGGSPFMCVFKRSGPNLLASREGPRVSGSTEGLCISQYQMRQTRQPHLCAAFGGLNSLEQGPSCGLGRIRGSASNANHSKDHRQQCYFTWEE